MVLLCSACWVHAIGRWHALWPASEAHSYLGLRRASGNCNSAMRVINGVHYALIDGLVSWGFNWQSRAPARRFASLSVTNCRHTVKGACRLLLPFIMLPLIDSLFLIC